MRAVSTYLSTSILPLRKSRPPADRSGVSLVEASSGPGASLVLLGRAMREPPAPSLNGPVTGCLGLDRFDVCHACSKSPSDEDQEASLNHGQSIGTVRIRRQETKALTTCANWY